MTVALGEKTNCGLARIPNQALKVFKRLAPCCVYVVGAAGTESPLKIGVATDIGKRMNGLQSAHWQDLALHSHHWFASDIIARAVESDVHALLDKVNRRKRGEWFDVELEWADKTIKFAAAKRKFAVYSYDEIVERCVKIADAPPGGLANQFLPAIKDL